MADIHEEVHEEVKKNPLTVQRAVGLILSTLARLPSEGERDRTMQAVAAISGRQMKVPGT